VDSIGPMQPRAVFATLLLSALLAGCSAKATGYPHQYLLEADELPEGLKLSEVPPDMPVQGNPAEVPANLLSGMGEEFRDFVPEKVWVEFLENASSDSSSGSEGGLLIASGFWTDESQAKKAIDEIRSQSDNEVCAHESAGMVLRDRNVVVIVGGNDGMSSWLAPIKAALEKKAPGLEDVC
jgi:hypothetical protein